MKDQRAAGKAAGHTDPVQLQFNQQFFSQVPPTRLTAPPFTERTAFESRSFNVSRRSFSFLTPFALLLVSRLLVISKLLSTQLVNDEVSRPK